MGASYGGYAALAGATFTRDLYACAVSYAGIADVSSILGLARGAGADSSLMHYWEDRVGATYAESKSLQAIRPPSTPTRCRAADPAPATATRTRSCPSSRACREETALTAAGKKVRFVRLVGSDHDMDHSDVRLSVLKETEAFLARPISAIELPPGWTL